MTDIDKQLLLDVKDVEEHNFFLQDKLIALATAILGATAIMLGNNQLTNLNLVLLKFSWCCLGIYLVFAVGSMWGGLRWKVLRTTRNALIKIDTDFFNQSPLTEEVKEKRAVLAILPMKETILWACKYKKKKDDPMFRAFSALYEKHKDSLYVTRFLANQSLNLSKRDHVMMFFTLYGEWSYVAFAFGIILLILSAL